MIVSWCSQLDAYKQNKLGRFSHIFDTSYKIYGEIFKHYFIYLVIVYLY